MSTPGQHPDSLSSWRQDVKQLAEFLRTNHPANVIMPLRETGNKSPFFPHKGGQWTWQHFDSWLGNCREPSDIGILLRDMVVLDADNQDQVQKLEEMYPACLTCPCAQTRKGKHYYFLRTSLCDELGMTDAPGIQPQLDFKTVTASHHADPSGNSVATAGVIVVPPSTNKTWVRSLLDTPLNPLPEDIVRDLHKNRRSNKGRCSQTRPEKVPHEEEKVMVEKVKELLAKMGDTTSSFGSSTGLSEDIVSLAFRNGTNGRTCPSGQDHSSNNFYIHCHLDGTCHYYCLSSKCRKKTCIGRWKEVGTEVMEALPPNGIDILKTALHPSRFEDEKALAGALKGCYGKNSFRIFQQLMRGQGTSMARLEAAFEEAKAADPGRLVRWACGDSPEYENAIKESNIGPPATTDKRAAEAFRSYMFHHCGARFVYSDGDTRYYWDGSRFQHNNDHAHTKRLALEHGGAIAAAFNISPQMYANESSLKSICKVLDPLTLNRNFPQKVNSNKGLVGFDNGVLELETGIFRDAELEDYITMTVGYDYPGDRDKEKEKEVSEFFKKVFPNEKLREFVLGRLASCLEGGNEEEKGPFWTGASGANGKSKTAELMRLVLGDYAGVLESSQFTTTRSSGGANSQLASVMFCRFLTIEEPDTAGGSIFNWPFYKELTGRGRIQVRNLYEKAIASIQPHFTLFFIFNSLPQGNETVDKAVQRRMEIVPFQSEFTENPSLPHQFPIDVSLSKKFLGWRQHLFNILYHDYYRPYIEGGRTLQVPEVCTETMHAILETDNVVQLWFSERVTIKNNGYLTLVEAKEDFYSSWIPASGRSAKGINSKRLKEQITAILNREPVGQVMNASTGGRKLSNVWAGVALKEL